MYNVGDNVFVFSDKAWRRARVLLLKKRGWHLLVTDNGKEVNRQEYDICRNSRHVFDVLVSAGLILVAKPNTESDEAYIQSFLDAKNCCAEAAYWYLRLMNGDRESCDKLNLLWQSYEVDVQLQSLPH